MKLPIKDTPSVTETQEEAIEDEIEGIQKITVNLRPIMTIYTEKRLQLPMFKRITIKKRSLQRKLQHFLILFQAIKYDHLLSRPLVQKVILRKFSIKHDLN